MGLKRAFCATVLSMCAVSGTARADTGSHPRVALRLDPCLATDDAEVRRIAAIELDARLADESESDTTQVHATCEGSFVRIEAIDPITGKSLSRVVNLAAEAASARPRLLAIAIAELVSASWTELAYNPAPQVPPASPAPSEEAKAAALGVVRARRDVSTSLGPPSVPLAPRTTFGPGPGEPAKPRELASPPSSETAPSPLVSGLWRMEGLFEARALPSPGLTSIGFGARVSRRRKGSVGFRVDVLADYGQRTTSLGTVSVDALSMGPSAFLEAKRGVFAFQAGAGLRLGLASLVGHPSSAQDRGASLLSAWGGPFANVDIYAEVIHRVALGLGGELGDAPFPARAQVVGPSGGDVSIVGAWFGAHVGVAGVF